MERGECLDKAKAIISGEREQTYNGPEDSFGRVGLLWTAYLRGKFGGAAPEIVAVDVALMMDLLKTARLQVAPGHEDSWVDKAGYSGCGAEIGTNTKGEAACS